MKKYIIFLISASIIICILIIGLIHHNMTIETVKFDGEGFGNYDYNDIYKFTDKEEVLNVNENAYKTTVVGAGLANVKENFIGDYGNCVYRFTYVNAMTVYPDISVKIVLSGKETGDLQLLEQLDFKKYRRINKKLTNKDIEKFLKIKNAFEIGSLETFDDETGEDGGFYCFESFENNTNNSIIRWCNNHQCEEFMYDLQSWIKTM